MRLLYNNDKIKFLARRLLSSRLFWVMVLVLASLALVVGQAGWYVSGQDDTVTGADLIVALGGGAGSRDVKASQLFTAGYAPRVLLTGLENSAEATQPHYLHWRGAAFYRSSRTG